MWPIDPSALLGEMLKAGATFVVLFLLESAADFALLLLLAAEERLGGVVEAVVTFPLPLIGAGFVVVITAGWVRGSSIHNYKNRMITYGGLKR